MWQSLEGKNGIKPAVEEKAVRMLRLREVDWLTQGHTASVSV